MQGDKRRWLQRLEAAGSRGIYNHFDIYPASVRLVASRRDV